MPALAGSLIGIFMLVRGWRFAVSLITGRG
jgi:hypothetical protein